MDLLLKLISWVISFSFNLVLVTCVYSYHYLSALFDMPVDLWNILNDDLEEDS